MTVTTIYEDGEILTVTGEDYAPSGDILVSGKPVSSQSRASRLATLRAAVLCNGAELRKENGAAALVSDPTEGALLVAAAKAGLWKQGPRKRGPVPP